jgi:hypothetical protein
MLYQEHFGKADQSVGILASPHEAKLVHFFLKDDMYNIYDTLFDLIQREVNQDHSVEFLSVTSEQFDKIWNASLYSYEEISESMNTKDT